MAWGRKKDDDGTFGEAVVYTIIGLVANPIRGKLDELRQQFDELERIAKTPDRETPPKTRRLNPLRIHDTARDRKPGRRQ